MVAVACGGVDELAGIAGGWNQSESEIRISSLDGLEVSFFFLPFLSFGFYYIRSRERDGPCTTNFNIRKSFLD
jgi:hypothetical protein